MKINCASALVWELLVAGILGWSVSATAQTYYLVSSAGTNTNRDNYTGTVGYRFTVATSLDVDGLGFYDSAGDGLARSHDVGLWNNSGTLVTSVTVAAGTGATLANGYRWVTLSPPVLLSGGGTYTIGAQVASGSGDAWPDVTGGGMINTFIVSTDWASRHSDVSVPLVYPTYGYKTSDGFMAPNLRAQIAPITLTNPGFEVPTLADGTAGALSPGWIATPTAGGIGAGTLNPNSSMHAGGNAPEGSNILYCYVDTSYGVTQDCVAAQVLVWSPMEKTRYTLTVKVGARLDCPNSGYAVRLGYGTAINSFTVLAEDDHPTALAAGAWITSTVTYNCPTNIAQPLQVQLIATAIP